MVYLLSSMPYLDQYNKCYKNILTINVEPNGPLKAIVRRINPSKLSVFQEQSSCCHNQTCYYAVNSFHNPHELLCIDEIPQLFTFLLTNNYTIDNSLTKLMNKSSIKMTNPLLCFITYNP